MTTHKRTTRCRVIGASGRQLKTAKPPVLTTATMHRYYACTTCHERRFYEYELIRCFECNGALSVCVACSLAHPLPISQRLCQRCRLHTGDN